AQACVGTACMQIWSTADGGGALTIQWHFDDPVIHAPGGFCASGQCSFSTIDPGLITSTDPPPAGYFALADGTAVRIEIVADAPEAKLKIGNDILDVAGESTLLGTAPTLHEHPSWQLKLSQGVLGDYAMSFRLTTDSALYADSEVFAVRISNQPTPTPEGPTPSATPTATATPAPQACVGDCDGDGRVSIAELLSAVRIPLGDPPDTCPAADADGDGTVGINELIAAVNNALNGCPSAPTPTATRPATFAEIQQSIFSPRCSIPTCHDSEFASGDLVLEADHAYDQLVGVAPAIDAASQAGMLRVDAGHPENSFLLSKLQGPPLGQGSRMPLTGDPLTADEIQLIREWIAAGALR
ncbi:MAG: hypothetical protein ABI629_09455, partial [bacterium]